MLFVQRWWFLAAATREGYNVMSLDSDLRITTDPLKMVRSASLRSFGLLLSGDFGFPELTGHAGNPHQDHVPIECHTATRRPGVRVRSGGDTWSERRLRLGARRAWSADFYGEGA